MKQHHRSVRTPPNIRWPFLHVSWCSPVQGLICRPVCKRGLCSPIQKSVAGDETQILGKRLRLPIILTEYEGRSQAEIGEILGCTPKAVETRFYRARQQLRVGLGKLLDSV